MSLLLRQPLAVVLLAVLPACASDGGNAIDVDVELVVAPWAASEFTVEDHGAIVDIIGAGGFIDFTLNPDSSTVGTLFVPAGANGGFDLLASLVGTWSRRGTTITLDHQADTFLRDMDLEFDGQELSGRLNSGGVITRVVMAFALPVP